jgi:hypothetical protein
MLAEELRHTRPVTDRGGRQIGASAGVIPTKRETASIEVRSWFPSSSSHNRLPPLGLRAPVQRGRPWCGPFERGCPRKGHPYDDETCGVANRSARERGHHPLVALNLFGRDQRAQDFPRLVPGLSLA